MSTWRFSRIPQQTKNNRSKEKEKIETVLRGIEAFLDAVGAKSADGKNDYSPRKVDRVRRLPKKVVNTNVQQATQQDESDENSLFKWDA